MNAQISLLSHKVLIRVFSVLLENHCIHLNISMYIKDSDQTETLPEDQGPVVQSIVSLMSLLVVKMLTALVSTVSNSQLFLLKKCE